MARLAGSWMSVGAGKSGNPWARLTAPTRSARRVISRITDSVKNLVRWETSVGMASQFYRPSKSDANFWNRYRQTGPRITLPPLRVCRSRRRFLGNRFLEQPGPLLQAPFVDNLDIEAPVAADLESGQLALLQEAIDGRAMNAEIVRQFIDGENFRGCGHVRWIPLVFLSGLTTVKLCTTINWLVVIRTKPAHRFLQE